MDKNFLNQSRTLPLDKKILLSKEKIRQFIDALGEEHVYISFSGGKDSTVLLKLIRELYPEIPAVYIDTGLEYPEVKKFIKTFDNIEIVRPKMSFKEVLQKYGYPVISKEAATQIHYARRALTLGDKEKYERYALGKRINKKTGEIYYYNRFSRLGLKMLETNIPISAQCCQIMKKNPVKKYEKQNQRFPFLGLLAEESKLRETEILKQDCFNVYNGERPRSLPLAFWTEQDILKYIKDTNLQIPVYGKITEENGILKCSGVSRTGCCYCMFGVHREKQPNRFQILKQIDPKIYDYCMKPVEDGGLGIKRILEIMEVPFE